jgi:hypothetical protein
MITYIERNGPPEGMACPAVLWDWCREPITQHGNVLWRPEWPDGVYTITALAFTHKHCNRDFEDAHPGSWSSGELRVFLQQLANNVERGFRREHNVEYIAPAPSRCRLGRYRRERVPS